jgi:hypothetical protein
MARSRIPTEDQFAELSSLALRASVNATVAYNKVFPDVFRDMGIRQRPEYDYLGMTTTRPDPDTAVFAFSYLKVTGTPTEDAFLFQFDPPELTPHPGKKLERLLAEYGGHHHGPKDYFVFSNSVT